MVYFLEIDEYSFPRDSESTTLIIIFITKPCLFFNLCHIFKTKCYDCGVKMVESWRTAHMPIDLSFFCNQSGFLFHSSISWSWCKKLKLVVYTINFVYNTQCIHFLRPSLWVMNYNGPKLFIYYEIELTSFSRILWNQHFGKTWIDRYGNFWNPINRKMRKKHIDSWDCFVYNQIINDLVVETVEKSFSTTK